MFKKYKSNLNSFHIIVILFVISKIVIYQNFFQIHQNLNSYWQLAPLDLLRNDLINTIMYLHSQPPLWNIIIGFLLKLTNSDLVILTKIIHLFHCFFSFIILLIIKFYCKEFKLSKFNSLTVFIFFIIHPSVIFYENLPFYSHSVTFLITILSYLIYQLLKTQNYKYEVYFYIVTIFLIYLISAFHPFLLILFFIIFRFVNYRNGKHDKIIFKIINFIPIIIVAFMPYLKNHHVFGTFTKGTWSGFQIAVTTMHIPGNYVIGHALGSVCQLGNPFGGQYYEKNIDREKEIKNYFLKYKKDKNELNHKTLIGKKSFRNNLGFITRSEWCLEKNLELIKNNKLLWVKGRINEFILPHVQLGIDYDIIEFPKGYEDIKKFKKKLFDNNLIKKTKQILILIFMISIYLLFFYKIILSRDKNYIRYFYFLVFMLYGYIMTISGIFGNQEGQRFMHYGFIIQILFIIELMRLKNIR